MSDIDALAARVKEAAGRVQSIMPGHGVMLNAANVLAILADREALKAERDARLSAMADAYQAVGALGEAFGLDENEHYIRLLDVLSRQKTEDGKDLLPFPCTAEDLAPNAVIALTARLAEVLRERDEARAALKPFAEYPIADSERNETYQLTGRKNPAIGNFIAITSGDMRRARAILSEIQSATAEQPKAEVGK